jgi:hypothetical protein
VASPVVSVFRCLKALLAAFVALWRSAARQMAKVRRQISSVVF